jgi:hypothetical protein
MFRRLAFSLVAVLPLLSACADHPVAPVVGPESSSAAIISTGGINLEGVLEFAVLPNLSQNRHAAKLIRAAEGGSVELNGFRVDIPAGALPADTVITIDLPGDALLGKRVMAEFGPHGIQFNTPVTIHFPLTGVLLGGERLEVGRWENGGWTSLGGAISADGRSLFSTTPHFSTYAGRKDVVAGG